MLNSRKTLINSLIFFLWALVFIAGIVKHEFWRDEMRALSIAISAPGFSDLPAYLKNEGHPLLWYFVLKLAYNIFHTTWVLPLVSFMFSAGICLLVLFRSPFPLLAKILLVFGYYCLYEYGINCRNYGIAGFFMLLFAEQYTRRPDRIFILGFYLALIAQTNFFALVCGSLIGLWMFAESVGKGEMNTRFFIALIPALCSVVCAFIIIFPNSDTLVVRQNLVDFNLFQDVWLVGYGFDDFIDFGQKFSIYMLSGMLILSIAMLANRPWMIVASILALLFMSFFALCIKGISPHQMGMYFYMVVTFAWINYENIKGILKKKSLASALYWISISVNMVIIAILLIRGMDKYKTDLIHSKSESKVFGKWCKEHISTTDILIVEPDYTMDGVMFYHYQPFYMPRENRKGTYVHFTSQNRQYLSIKELVKTSDSLSTGYRNTYLVFNRKVANADSIYTYSYTKKFKVTKTDYENFSSRYDLIDSFNHNFLNEENYYVYKKQKVVPAP